ncbi:TorD/DmsD family molecular chaperone [Limisalsivibrio acetivorans]|uniref:TorD/DmsD family molecular chaperone n=1 Tax=Limisalsivibrio acetivorans TaxID=1304888 RepID=UPI0003B5BE5A|nr:molecular chaperone TorD family protein [Limisalsivibrio acetivorans]
MSSMAEFKSALNEEDAVKAGEILSKAEPDKEGLKSLSSVFMFLSVIFRYPEDTVYETIDKYSPEFQEFISEYTDRALVPGKQIDMETEYVKLFINDYGGVKATPYASVYMGDEQLLWGDDMVRLKNIMAAEGFMRDESVKELEDHVYLVLEFFGLVLEKVADEENSDCRLGSLSTLLSVSRDFFPVFAGPFADKVIAETETEFYKTASMLLKGFLNDTENILEELIFN